MTRGQQESTEELDMELNEAFVRLEQIESELCELENERDQLNDFVKSKAN
jgi:predicted nuclease with TOPRIM domain